MLEATRVGDGPIIWPHMDGRIGDNINGASLIRMPDWAPGLGRYHLYFAHHKGKYIRLAYADRVEGPWTIHTPGALGLADSLFPSGELPDPSPEARPDWARGLKGGYFYTHIASPDVHVDEEARLIRMYYHGMLEDGDQQTRLANSRDGLTFTPEEPLLGPSYFRVFRHRGWFYTLTWRGLLLRARAWEGPFQPGPRLIPHEIRDGVDRWMRHAEVHCAGDLLHIFYTRMGDRPERILYANVDLRRDWQDWAPSEPITLLEPERNWEGADLPLTHSLVGAAEARARELRDPCVFVDGDATAWLLYCGAGESAIGLARLDGFAGGLDDPPRAGIRATPLRDALRDLLGEDLPLTVP